MTIDAVSHADWTETLAACADGSIDMVLCDLPYGTTQNHWDTPIDLGAWWPEIRRVTKPTAAVVLFAQCPFDKVLGVSNIRECRYDWVWRKRNATGHLNAKKAPLKAHEMVLVFYRKAPHYKPQMAPRTTKRIHDTRRMTTKSTTYGKDSKPSQWTDNGLRYPTSVLEFPSDREIGVDQHPTRKPVDLCRYLIRTYTRPGEIVLDPTCGSGTTAVAAVMEQRRFIVGDSDARWAKHAAERVRDAQAQQPLFRGAA